MNFLAHAYLSGKNQEIIIGNMIGDFVKGNPKGKFPEKVIEGILLHRKIDSYTDSHKLVLQGKKLFSSKRRRYAGIILDIVFDHFLSQKWADYSNADLDTYAQSIYSLLEKNNNILPEQMRQILPRMKKYNWFVIYKDLKTIDRAIDNVSERLKKPNSLAGAIEEVEKNYDSLETIFLEFFEDLQEETKTMLI